MNDHESEARLMRAFREAGWVAEQLNILYTTDALIELRKRMFPTPFLDLTVEQAVMEQALEDASVGHGMMYKAVRRKLMFANIRTIRELVKLTESEAVRVFGSSKQNKAFRAIEALLAKHGLYFGMKLS